MKKRQKIESRRWFKKSEKRAILEKSDGVCCHCGTPLAIGDTFTIEHVIPIAKGGTNDLSNLIALCEGCNKTKADLIVQPSIYFKYLKPEYLQELTTNQLKYYRDFSWLSLNDALPDDIRLTDTSYIQFIAKGYTGDHQVKTLLNKFTLSKVYYCDLDEVYWYTCEYFTKYMPDVYDSKTYVKEFLSSYFEAGALYSLRKPNGELAAIIPLYYSSYFKGYLLPCISTIICLYPKPDYDKAILCSIHAILHELYSMMDKPVLVYSYEYFKDIKLQTRILNLMRMGVTSLADIDSVISEFRRSSSLALTPYTELDKNAMEKCLDECEVIDFVKDTSNFLLERLGLTLDEVVAIFKDKTNGYMEYVNDMEEFLNNDHSDTIPDGVEVAPKSALKVIAKQYLRGNKKIKAEDGCGLFYDGLFILMRVLLSKEELSKSWLASADTFYKRLPDIRKFVNDNNARGMLAGAVQLQNGVVPFKEESVYKVSRNKLYFHGVKRLFPLYLLALLYVILAFVLRVFFSSTLLPISLVLVAILCVLFGFRYIKVRLGVSHLDIVKRDNLDMLSARLKYIIPTGEVLDTACYERWLSVLYILSSINMLFGVTQEDLDKLQDLSQESIARIAMLRDMVLRYGLFIRTNLEKLIYYK